MSALSSTASAEVGGVTVSRTGSVNLGFLKLVSSRTCSVKSCGILALLTGISHLAAFRAGGCKLIEEVMSLCVDYLAASLTADVMNCRRL